MKRFLLFSFLIVGFLHFGCSDNSSLVNPTNSELTNLAVQQTTPTLIKLPVTSLDKRKKVKSKIDGKKGGTVEIEGELQNGVKFEGKLKIPAGAFKGKMKFTIQLDNEYAGFIFGPDGATFDLPLIFSGEIEGLNLDGVDPDNVQFCFVDSDGNLIPVVYDKIEVNIEDGKLKVEKALLEHFSRYNWAK